MSIGVINAVQVFLCTLDSTEQPPKADRPFPFDITAGLFARLDSNVQIQDER